MSDFGYRTDGLYVPAGRSQEAVLATNKVLKNTYLLEVWDETAYKTTGSLIKSELTINKKGKIISIKKSVQETIFNRLNQ